MKKFLDQLDLITFGIVLIGAIWLLSSGIGSGRAHRDLALERAQGAQASLAAALAEDRYEEEPGARVLDIVGRVPEDIARQWAPGLEPHPLPAGFFYHGPTLTDLREGRDLELRFPPPTDPKLEAEIGLIRVIWGRDDRGTVPVTGYSVYRTGPDGAERRVAQVDPDQTVWVDTQVQAGRLYSYRVSAVTDEPLLVRRNRAESRRTRPTSVRGKRDYEIKLVSHEPDSDAIRVLIRKYGGGLWREKEFEVKKGDAIGGVDPGSEIDYGTGCRVAGIEESRITRQEERDEVQFDPQARVILQNGAPLTIRRSYQRPIRRVVLRLDNELGESESLELEVPL